MDLLVTGGAGFIGSTVASAAIDAGHRPIILDSLITGKREFTQGRVFYEGDIANPELVRQIFDDYPDIQAVIHCAALIVVPDSVARPIDYYEAYSGQCYRSCETHPGLQRSAVDQDR